MSIGSKFAKACKKEPVYVLLPVALIVGLFFARCDSGKAAERINDAIADTHIEHEPLEPEWP